MSLIIKYGYNVPGHIRPHHYFRLGIINAAGKNEEDLISISLGST